ncbi:MAG: hypothetical protein AAF621_00785 [Pseudomonadota bacterium]
MENNPPRDPEQQDLQEQLIREVQTNHTDDFGKNTSLNRISQLIKDGADPTLSDNDGKNAFHHAAYNGNLYAFYEMLKECLPGEKLNTALRRLDQAGYSPLSAPAESVICEYPETGELIGDPPFEFVMERGEEYPPGRTILRQAALDGKLALVVHSLISKASLTKGEFNGLLNIMYKSRYAQIMPLKGLSKKDKTPFTLGDALQMYDTISNIIRAREALLQAKTDEFNARFPQSSILEAPKHLDHLDLATRKPIVRKVVVPKSTLIPRLESSPTIGSTARFGF